MMTPPLALENHETPAVLADAVELVRPAKTSRAEFVITQAPRTGETVSAPFERLAAELAAQDAELLSLFVFGAVAAKTAIERAMRDALGECQWPITWADGAGCNGSPLAGLQAFAISGRPVRRVRLG